MECRGWQAVSMQISAQMAHLANRFRGGGNRLIINRLHIIVCICEFWRKNMLSSGYLRGEAVRKNYATKVQKKIGICKYFML